MDDKNALTANKRFGANPAERVLEAAGTLSESGESAIDNDEKKDKYI